MTRIRPSDRSPKPSRMPSGAPKTGYSLLNRPNGNRIRLMALVRLLNLSPSEIGKETGFSKSYVCRLLNPKDHDLSGSPEFWRILECKLGTIINQRASQYFTVPATPVARARAVLERLPEPVAEEMARAA